MTKYEEMTIESAKYGTGVTVYGYGTYGSTSVLAGQTKKQYLEGFDTLEQAITAVELIDDANDVSWSRQDLFDLKGI